MCVSLTPIDTLLKLFKVILFPTFPEDSPHSILKSLLNRCVYAMLYNITYMNIGIFIHTHISSKFLSDLFFLRVRSIVKYNMDVLLCKLVL